MAAALNTGRRLATRADQPDNCSRTRHGPYWLADPADLVTLTIVKLPEQDTTLRSQTAILEQALRDISNWPVSQTIHAAWRCRAIKVDAIADLHRNLVTGLERDWLPDPSREARVLKRADHTFDGLPERWTDILAGRRQCPEVRRSTPT